MCAVAPVVIAGAAIAGGLAKANADKQAAEANAAAGRRNAQVAELAASDALQRGEQDAARVQMHGSALEGKQRAAYAGSGVLVDSGSAERTVEDTVSLTEVDKATIRNNAQREAWGLKTEATNLRAAASDAEAAGRNAMLADIIGGVGGAVGALAPTYFQKPPVAPGQ